MAPIVPALELAGTAPLRYPSSLNGKGMEEVNRSSPWLPSAARSRAGLLEINLEVPQNFGFVDLARLAHARKRTRGGRGHGQRSDGRGVADQSGRQVTSRSSFPWEKKIPMVTAPPLTLLLADRCTALKDGTGSGA